MCLMVFTTLLFGPPSQLEFWKLTHAKTLEFKVTQWGMTSFDAPPKLRKMLTAKVQAQRPLSLRYEVIQMFPLKQVKHKSNEVYMVIITNDVFVSNGKQRVSLDKQSGTHRAYPAGASLPQIFADTKEDLLFCSPLLFEPNPLRHFKMKYEGVIRFGGVKGVSYFGYAPQEQSIKYKLLLNPKTRLPELLSIFEESSNKSLEEVVRLTFSDWRINHNLVPSIFTLRLPNNEHKPK